ncbi:female-specific lacrimal gland protein-like [Lepus europaeus]|uniref:female-specific lacrimal gland protein-like n=1 Tax=Lepus europaeus TaxID=9983 RepID=UPI002B4839CF|nr:female-specific lacrimal gland protein-like [Lepus europaeus]
MKTMMKALLLGLVVGVACADVDPTQVSGLWRTVAIASDNPALTADGGPLRVLLRNIQCDEGCKALTISFFVRDNGVCVLHTVVAQKNADGVYATDFEGQNYFKFLEQDNGHIDFLSQNVGADGTVTRVTLAAARDQELSDEHLARFTALTEENGIPRENVDRVAGTEMPRDPREAETLRDPQRSPETPRATRDPWDPQRTPETPRDARDPE